MKKAVNPDAGKQADEAQELFAQVAALLTDVHVNVIGAVLGTLLGAYLGAHEPADRDEVLNRLYSLASNVLGDLDGKNGIETAGGVEFQFSYDDDVRKQMERNPKLAEYVKDTTSRVRQALSDLEAGKYSSIDEAFRAIGLAQVDPDDLEELKDRFAARGKLS